MYIKPNNCYKSNRLIDFPNNDAYDRATTVQAYRYLCKYL